MRAMVIDDSRAMRMILKRIVAKLNFEAVEAGDGQEALDLLATMPEVPELALIDWNMPNMNGLEFVTKVRGDPRLREMTLVMVTTESEQSQIVRALAGAARRRQAGVGGALDGVHHRELARPPRLRVLAERRPEGRRCVPRHGARRGRPGGHLGRPR